MQRKCRYCHERGHNVRTCPVVNRDADRGYGMATHYKERAKRAVDTMRHVERVCSYCKLSGHNVATCPKKSEDNRDCIRKTKEFRRSFIIACKDLNLGIGTIIEHPAHGIGMIMGFDANLLHMNTLQSDGHCMRVLFPKAGGTFIVDLPSEMYNRLGVDYYSWKQKSFIRSKTTSCMLPSSLTDWKWEEVTDQKALLNTLGRK